MKTKDKKNTWSTERAIRIGLLLGPWTHRVATVRGVPPTSLPVRIQDVKQRACDETMHQ